VKALFPKRFDEQIEPEFAFGDGFRIAERLAQPVARIPRTA
jgi:hypothetical protein